MSPLQDPQITTREAVPTAVVSGTLSFDALRGFYDRSFGAVAAAIARQGQAPAGPAFGFYLRPPSDTVELEVGFPTSHALTADGEVRASQLPAGEVATAVHAGPYDELSQSWQALADWITEQGRQPGPQLWEVYLTAPTPGADASAMRTELSWLLAD